MLPAILLALREGMEAALLIGIALGALRRLGRPELAIEVVLERERLGTLRGVGGQQRARAARVGPRDDVGRIGEHAFRRDQHRHRTPAGALGRMSSG